MIQQLFDWLSPSATQQVALALTHSLWQGMIVAFLLDAGLRLFRDQTPADGMEPASSTPTRTRAHARYMTACLGLLTLAAIPIVNLMVIESAPDPVARLDSAAEASAGEPLATTTPITAPARSTAAAQAPVDEPVSDAPNPAAAANESLVGTRPAKEAATAAPLMPWAKRVFLQLFFWTWFLGVTFLSVWHLVGWALSQRLRHGGTTVSNEILALVERAAFQLGVHQTIDVRQTLKATTPMVIGWIKPALILPTKLLAGLAPHELKAVLAHELAHVKRHDYLMNLAQTAVETLMFYHPAVWWVSGRIRCEREFCADDLAMQVCDRREEYAQSLVAVAETSLAIPAHAVAVTGGSLLQRVHRILRFPAQPSPLPWPAKCSALVGVASALCLGVAMIAVAENRPAETRQSADLIELTSELADIPESREDLSAKEDSENDLAMLAPEKRADKRDRTTEDKAELDATAEEPAFQIEHNTKTRQWRAMIAHARNLPSLRAGNGQLTLMRIVLKDGNPNAPIQLTSTKLVLPQDGSGGGLYQQIKNGDFILVEHINSARRKNEKDPVEIGSFTHQRATVWVDVPPRGKLGVLGDVILPPVPTEKMGRIVAIAQSDSRRPINVRQLRIGPIAVGGPYGETLPFRLNVPADTGKIAPGTYKILAPDFDMVKSRWTVEVRPGEVTQLQFLAHSQRQIEKVTEEHVADVAPKQRRARAPRREKPKQKTDGIPPALGEKSPHSDVVQFLTIPPAKLPEGCRRNEPRTATIVPMGVVLDRKPVRGFAAFFGVDALDRNEVQAAVSVVYEQAGERKGMEIGVYALCFSDDEAADQVVGRLPKGAVGHDNDRTFISNGALALCVWRDTGVSNSAFEWFCEYFRNTAFRSRE